MVVHIANVGVVSIRPFKCCVKQEKAVGGSGKQGGSYCGHNDCAQLSVEDRSTCISGDLQGCPDPASNKSEYKANIPDLLGSCECAERLSS